MAAMLICSIIGGKRKKPVYLCLNGVVTLFSMFLTTVSKCCATYGIMPHQRLRGYSLPLNRIDHNPMILKI